MGLGSGVLPFAILGLGSAVWGWDSRLAVCSLLFGGCDSGLGAGVAVLGGRKFTVLPGVCGLDAMTWLAVCDLALRAV